MALASGKVVGYAFAYAADYFDEPSVWSLDSVAVLDDYQSCAVGSRLVRELGRWVAVHQPDATFQAVALVGDGMCARERWLRRLGFTADASDFIFSIKCRDLDA